MKNSNRILLIVVAAVAFGVLMGLRGTAAFGWQRAILAAVAFIVLGLLASYLFARRRE